QNGSRESPDANCNDQKIHDQLPLNGLHPLINAGGIVTPQIPSHTRPVRFTSASSSAVNFQHDTTVGMPPHPARAIDSGAHSSSVILGGRPRQASDSSNDAGKAMIKSPPLLPPNRDPPAMVPATGNRDTGPRNRLAAECAGPL